MCTVNIRGKYHCFFAMPNYNFMMITQMSSNTIFDQPHYSIYDQ